MPLNTQALSNKFGVVITGVDLSKELDEKLFNEIVDVFVKKQVLVFRDQHIEPQHQVAFSRRFGPLEMLYDEDQRVPGFPEVAILSNEKVDGKFIGVVAAGDFWHSDQSYRRETSLATLLYAHKLPKQGGDTEFADMHGFTGVDDVFAGERNFFVAYGRKPDPTILTRKLGVDYEITNTNIKRWSVGSPIQAPLDSLMDLIREHAIKADDVQRIVVRVAHQGANTVDNRVMSASTTA